MKSMDKLTTGVAYGTSAGSAGICIIVRLSWAVNHYRDNAIAYKRAAR